jgi:CHASE2 domain-containing sensor protein
LRNRVVSVLAVLFGLAVGTVTLQGWGPALPAVLGALVVGVLHLAVERSRERERS